jgi:steroid Delta-isomerase
VDLQRLAADHVRRFNASAAAGDFSPLVESLADDATMAFKGVDVGPFSGKAAIAEAYRQAPPDDTIDVIDVRATGPDSALVEYAWHAAPQRGRGRLRLSWRPDGLLRTLEIELP